MKYNPSLRKKVMKLSKGKSFSFWKSYYVDASKQLKVMDGDKVVSYMTYAGNMATVDYSQCDSLVPITEPVVEDSHYKVNLLHSREMEYKANLSNQDRVVGGKHLALVDGGANGVIIGLDIKILYFNPDGKQVSIGIAGDHQLTGNKLCCGCSVANQAMDGSDYFGPKELK